MVTQNSIIYVHIQVCTCVAFTTNYHFVVCFRNTLRYTQSAALESTDKSGSSNVFLGKKNKDFQFSDIKPYKVDFVECSARGGRDKEEFDLAALEDWLAKTA